MIVVCLLLEPAHHGLAVSPARRGTGHWLVPRFINTAGVEVEGGVGRTFVLVACVVVGEVSVDVALATTLPSISLKSLLQARIII